jgi:hypothetical protein
LSANNSFVSEQISITHQPLANQQYFSLRINQHQYVFTSIFLRSNYTCSCKIGFKVWKETQILMFYFEEKLKAPDSLAGQGGARPNIAALRLNNDERIAMWRCHGEPKVAFASGVHKTTANRAAHHRVLVLRRREVAALVWWRD